MEPPYCLPRRVVLLLWRDSAEEPIFSEYKPSSSVYRFVADLRRDVLVNDDYPDILARLTKPDNTGIVSHYEKVVNLLMSEFPEIIFWADMPAHKHGTTPREPFHTKAVAEDKPFSSLDSNLHRLRIPVIVNQEILSGCGLEYPRQNKASTYRLNKIFLKTVILHELVHWIRAVLCDKPAPIGLDCNGLTRSGIDNLKDSASVPCGECSFLENKFWGGQMCAYFSSSMALMDGIWDEIVGIGFEVKEGEIFQVNEQTDEPLLWALERLQGKFVKKYIHGDCPPRAAEAPFCTKYVSCSSPSHHLPPRQQNSLKATEVVTSSPATTDPLSMSTSSSFTSTASSHTSADGSMGSGYDHDASVFFGRPVFSTRNFRQDCCGPVPEELLRAIAIINGNKEG